jgi:hypothetical protein
LTPGLTAVVKSMVREEAVSVKDRSKSAAAARWVARGLSLLILLFWGFFLVAHLVGEEGRPSRPLNWKDFVALSALTLSLAGLAIAWRWERAGAAVALTAITVCAAVNWRVLLFPGALIPAAAALFLFSWWAGKQPRRGGGARVLSAPESPGN